VFDEEIPRAVCRRLKGSVLTGTGRKGKYFWLTFDSGDALLMHLGMTGWIEQRYPEGERPRFAKLESVFEDGSRFAFRDARRLGRVRLRRDPLEGLPVARLGFDPYLDDPGAGWFADALRGRKTPVKAALLDQGFTAGVGNWLADEILFQAKIDPRRRGSELSAAEARLVYRVMRRIVKKAVEVGADDARFPATWLFHHRWGKNAEAKTSTGAKIEHLTVGGRTTAWVPSVQR
jgi:formamidopyrimidine-DNA glycosylase